MTHILQGGVYLTKHAQTFSFDVNNKILLNYYLQISLLFKLLKLVSIYIYIYIYNYIQERKNIFKMNKEIGMLLPKKELIQVE